MQRNSNGMTRATAKSSAGMTFVEVLFAVAFVSLVFTAIFGVFRLSIEVVSGSKARVGALSLAVERMEQIRSLPYDSVGTVNGIPNGPLVQEETLSLNQTSYTRRTFITYVDDPADGLAGADQNGIMTDYKRAKVELRWTIRGIERVYSVVSNIIPPGIESVSGGGTLRIQVFNALAVPVSGATVHIVNTTGTSTVDVTTYTNASGIVVFPGAPAGTGYEVTVGKSGYSSAQTYDSSASNPNPTPGHLSVANAQTTTGSFFIDTLAALTVRTWEPIKQAQWLDDFTDNSQLVSLASTTVAGSALSLVGGETSGSAQSVSIAPAYLSSWESASWNGSTPAGSTATVHVYSVTGGTYTLLPDGVLAGNTAGFASSPISLVGVSTSTYPELALGVDFASDGVATPSINDWTVTYMKGPTPLPNITFSMQGAKTIGTDGGGVPIYKYSLSHTTDSSGVFSTSTLEWDAYSFNISAAENLDVAESCGPTPLSIAPGASLSLGLFLLPHTSDSLRVVVTDSTTGAVIDSASVHATKIGFDNTKNTSSCGQVFWSGLTAGSYNLNVSKSGYQTESAFVATVSGTTVVTVPLTPL